MKVSLIWIDTGYLIPDISFLKQRILCHILSLHCCPHFLQHSVLKLILALPVDKIIICICKFFCYELCLFVCDGPFNYWRFFYLLTKLYWFILMVFTGNMFSTVRGHVFQWTLLKDEEGENQQLVPESILSFVEFRDSSYSVDPIISSLEEMVKRERVEEGECVNEVLNIN